MSERWGVLLTGRWSRRWLCIVENKSDADTIAFALQFAGCYSGERIEVLLVEEGEAGGDG